METEKRWLSVDGPALVRKMGIRKGHTVVDFGCGAGYYTFPASIVVQSTGRVYALDNDEEVIRNIAKKAKESQYSNIIPLLVQKDLSLELGKGIADVVLLFDVLHYFNEKERNCFQKSTVSWRITVWYLFIQNIINSILLCGHWLIWISRTSSKK